MSTGRSVTVKVTEHTASFELLYSFSLWVAADPSLLAPGMPTRVHFEPVSVSMVRKYLAAIQTWHLAQGWPTLLSEDNHNCIN